MIEAASLALKQRGFSVKRARGVVDVSSPQPFAERFAVFGAALYAVAIVVEAVRSGAWLAAALFVLIAAGALWVAGGRVRYRLSRDVIEISWHFPSRDRTTHLATSDVIDFVAVGGVVRALVRGGGAVDLPRGTMRGDDEAHALATFLGAHLAELREHGAGYRTF